MLLKDFRFPQYCAFPIQVLNRLSQNAIHVGLTFSPNLLLKQSISLEYFKTVLTISCWVELFIFLAVLFA